MVARSLTSVLTWGGLHFRPGSIVRVRRERLLQRGNGIGPRFQGAPIKPPRLRSGGKPARVFDRTRASALAQ